MNVNDEIVITGKIIAIDPITKNCWIALKNKNTSSEYHDLTVAIPQQYVIKKQSISFDIIDNTEKETKNTIQNEIKYDSDDDDKKQTDLNDISPESVEKSWNKLNEANIDQQTMQIESSQRCDAWFLNECPQTKRMLFILQYYNKWIQNQSKQKV